MAMIPIINPSTFVTSGFLFPNTVRQFKPCTITKAQRNHASTTIYNFGVVSFDMAVQLAPAGRNLPEASYVPTIDEDHCLVCYGDLTLRGKTPCQHDEICGLCHLRLRFLHNDKKCPICKQENEFLIVDSDRNKIFEDYPMWGDEIGADFTRREDVGMFFRTAYYEVEILPLFRYACQKCDYSTDQEPYAKKPPYRLLQDHLRTQHRLTLCTLCVDHKRDFVSRLRRFTPAQLQKHMKQGDGATSGFSGHPICQFCAPKRFYDLASLHQHLYKDHYKCHVCDKLGLDNQFFKNYISLERHFDRQHFLCHEGQCLAARFVVFDSELDLRAHQLSVHGGTSSRSTKINLEFRTRRVGYDGSGLEDRQAPPSDSDFNFGLDGQAFVPPALPNSGGGGSTGDQNSQGIQLHPLHLQRTEELRAQAAAIREQQALESQEESFPSLQSTNDGASSSPLVSWSSLSALSTLKRPKKQAGQVTEEDFPSLAPSSSSAKVKTQKPATLASLGATRRQFAAMTASAARPAPSLNWSSTATAPKPVPPPPTETIPATNPQTNLAASNFPALSPTTVNRPTIPMAYDYAKKESPKPEKPAGPRIVNTMEFPTIGAAYNIQSKGNSVRDRVLAGHSAPTHQAMANVLQAPTLASAKTTMEEVKAILGPNKLKQMKQITKEFADGSLSPEGYVDQCAALFERGYADPDFWSFLPLVLDSCPNAEGVELAIIYMTSLKRQQFDDKKPAAKAISRPSSGNVGSSWGAGPSVIHQQPTPQLVAGKKKQAWGGNGSTTVIRAKAPPGSVAVAAATQGPTMGSATKFMAKEAKQQTKANSGAGGPKKNKGKQNDELKALAFRGK